MQTFEDVPVSVLRPYIDWTPFFLSWELAGKFPASWKMRWWGGGNAPYADANAMLDQLEQDRACAAPAS